MCIFSALLSICHVYLQLDSYPIGKILLDVFQNANKLVDLRTCSLRLVSF